MQACQEVVEELDLQLILPLRQLPPHIMQCPELYADDVVLLRAGQLVAQVKEGVRWRRELGLLGNLLRKGRLAEQLQGVQCGGGKLGRTEAIIELTEGVGHCLVIVVRLVRPLGAAAKVAADGVLLRAPDLAQGTESSLQAGGQGFWTLVVHR